MEQRLFSIVKHKVVDNSLLNLFKVMLTERKILYEDKTNNACKYIRIYYERSTPPTCRHTCFGHSNAILKEVLYKGSIITKTSKANAQVLNIKVKR